MKICSGIYLKKTRCHTRFRSDLAVYQKNQMLARVCTIFEESKTTLTISICKGSHKGDELQYSNFFEEHLEEISRVFYKIPLTSRLFITILKAGRMEKVGGRVVEGLPHRTDLRVC